MLMFKNENETRYDLRVVHKVPSEVVQLGQELVTFSRRWQTHTRGRQNRSGFRSFESSNAKLHSKCLYDRQQRGKYNKRMTVQQGRVKKFL